MSNKSPDTAGIKAAAKKKSDETLTKVIDALKIMENQSISINFNSVSNFTGVTKGWLYKQPAVRELIQQARGVTNNLLMRDQAVQLGLKNKEIDILTKQNKHLRELIVELRQQLEVAYAVVYKHDAG
ncbi:DUF6262 family protein [Legionella longbeachae]|uniref:DUF6262 family protein n=1 Tax=Legionella longbeachae TaxID=450 RepID=UPI0001BEB8FA|nr:DUF6262 family protein [Legionella longbeachae]EEZ93451.1 putative transposition regulatory protein TnpC [Legionella longbeachae D-4968]QIN34158.1 transposase [Legionella longbeachae]HBD7399124.1 transposase [Legionella pneumophila]